MQLHTAEALLLDVVDLGDYDRIVTFLTREQGKKRGVANGARRKHSRFGGQLQPLAKVRVTWSEKEGRELGRISSVELERSAEKLQKDLEGILVGAYLADHLIAFAQENEASDRLFRLLDSTLVALSEGVDRGLAMRYFETWVLRLAGLFPEPTECPSCGRELVTGEVVLPPGGDGLLCRECGGGGGRGVSEGALELLRRTARKSLPAMARRAPSGAVLEEVERICAQVRRVFLQHELKSYRVMRETLGAVETR